MRFSVTYMGFRRSGGHCGMYDLKFVIMADIAPAPGGGWTAPGVRARGWAASGA